MKYNKNLVSGKDFVRKLRTDPKTAAVAKRISQKERDIRSIILAGKCLRVIMCAIIALQLFHLYLLVIPMLD